MRRVPLLASVEHAEGENEAMTTTYTGVEPRTLAQIRADVAQLVDPIHIAVRGRVLTHDPLLDQLRAATEPGSSPQRGTSRRPVPKSRPPAQLDALDALGTLCVEVGQWHARLRLPEVPTATYGCEHASCRLAYGRRALGPRCASFRYAPVDWFKYALRQLLEAAPKLAPQLAEWLALDVREWWRSAAVQSGWRTAELLRVR
jgi:hypothetical protein